MNENVNHIWPRGDEGVNFIGPIKHSTKMSLPLPQNLNTPLSPLTLAFKPTLMWQGSRWRTPSINISEGPSRSVTPLHTSRYINILCKILISWGNVWLPCRRTIVDQAIGRWWFRLRAWVIARRGHFERLTFALIYWSIRFHILYDVSFKCWRW